MGAYAQAKLTPTRKGPRCTVAMTLAAFDEEDQAMLLADLASDLTSAAISRRLRAAGHRVLGETVQRHRRGDCACP